MAGRFFTKLSNDVLEATEQVANRMEEGLALLFNGGEPQRNNAGQTPASADHNPVRDDDDDQEHLEEELRNNPLQGIADSVVGGIMSGQMAPETPLEHFQAFRSAITWDEPFIMGLVAFQVVMFALCIYVSRPHRSLAPRLAVMSTIASIVKCSEKINEYAAQNWESFCTQNYFDRRGVFMMVMVCCPLLLDSLIMLFLFMREASQLLVKVKTAQLKEKQKQQRKVAASATATATTNRRKKKEQ